MTHRLTLGSCYTICSQTLGTLFTEAMKARCLSSRTVEQFRHLLTMGGKEWFVYSLIKVKNTGVMYSSL